MSPNRLRRELLAVLLLGFLIAPFLTAAAQAADITVFAAASLKNALDDAAKLYQTKTRDKVNISYAASSALAKQIEAGAPADIFFSADLNWTDYLQEKKLIDDASRHTLLGNTLVLVAPKKSTVELPVVRDFPIVQALGADGKLAMASVDSVPAGKYGKAALTYTRRAGRGSAACGAGGECPRGARLRRQGRGGARHRLRHRRQVRAGGSCGRQIPRGQPSQDPLSGRTYGFLQARGAQVPRLPVVVGGCTRLRGARLLGSGQSRLAEVQPIKKISARNQLKGKIVEVKKGQTTAHVKIDIGGGVIVTSSITNEAVDDLALAKGDDVIAVIKASDVMVSKMTLGRVAMAALVLAVIAPRLAWSEDPAILRGAVKQQLVLDEALLSIAAGGHRRRHVRNR